MIGYILFYLNLIIIVFAVSIKLNKKIDIIIFLSIASISIFEYLIGMIFNLLIARILIGILIIVCLGYLIYKCIKQKSIKVLIDKITPGFIFLTIIYIIVSIVYRNRMISQHNELGIWALIVKNMFLTDTLPKAGSNMLYTGYTPITGLWHYWFMSFHNEFLDGNLFVSSSFLQYSLVIGITSFIKDDSKIRKILTNVIFVGFIYTISVLAFSSTYVDPILGLTVVFCIIYVLNIKELKKEIIPLILMNTFLILVKENAFVFLVPIIILLLIKFISNKESSRKYLILSIILIAIIPYIIKSSWNIYLENNNLNIAGDVSDVTISNIIDIFKGNAPEYRYDTIFNYISHIFIESEFKIMKIDVSTMVLFITTLLIMFIMYIMKKDKDILYLLITIFLSTVFFVGSLLFVYLFVFAEWEAIYLSALVRYLQTINIINFCTLLYIVLDKFKNKNVIVIAFLIILIITGENRFIAQIKNTENAVNTTSEKRNAYKTLEKYRSLFKEDDKIYIVSDYDNLNLYQENANREIDMLITKYQMTPYRIYMYSDDDITEEQIKYKLKCDYTYIYFHKVTNNVRRQYNFLLVDDEHINSKDVFKVISQDGNLKIKKVIIPDIVDVLEN